MCSYKSLSKHHKSRSMFRVTVRLVVKRGLRKMLSDESQTSDLGIRPDLSIRGSGNYKKTIVFYYLLIYYLVSCISQPLPHLIKREGNQSNECVVLLMKMKRECTGERFSSSLKTWIFQNKVDNMSFGSWEMQLTDFYERVAKKTPSSLFQKIS